MNFFASSKSKTSKKHASKKGLALGVNVLAASVVQNSTPTPSPAPSSFNFFTRSCTKDHDTSSTPAAKPKSTKTRPRSSTTAVSKERVAVNATFINNDDLNLKVTVDSEALPPALTTLRAKPSYYEDLHTLSGYGELPFPSPVVSVPISPLAQPPTLPASGVTRLFEVAKPPAMAEEKKVYGGD
ncbi:hypothetical protein BT96DRAFT_179167 [Gymnopus androsaceus JB14]|uniref:Uncharacterized protein n=1 Tax=Gymnopus androsaceus JB14 TaxID=1447944 RepID=A0A6A4H9Q1_9AGAR|nr:hypothetical protein BT96DRAFT_179167 [Gymnopus androsaceus JB14]